MSNQIRTHIPEALTCPFCDSINFIRYGKYKGKHKTIQRYKCKTCTRAFRETTNTPLHWLHLKDKVGKYLEALDLGLSVRRAAKHTKISKNTAFDWRHKILSSLKAHPHQKESAAIAAITTINLPYSTKGKNLPQGPKKKDTKSILTVSETGIWLNKLPEKKQSINTAKLLARHLQNSHITHTQDRIISKAIKLQKNKKLPQKSIK